MALKTGGTNKGNSSGKASKSAAGPVGWLHSSQPDLVTGLAEFLRSLSIPSECRALPALLVKACGCLARFKTFKLEPTDRPTDATANNWQLSTLDLPTSKLRKKSKTTPSHAVRQSQRQASSLISRTRSTAEVHLHLS